MAPASMSAKPAEVERRAVSELRVAGRRLEGYAARFDEPANIGGFSETIRPGAFSDSLRDGRDVLALMDHDPTRVLARSRSGTLRLNEDGTGLGFSLDVPDTQAGRDALALAERGDLGGMSFGFSVRPGGERWEGRSRELQSVVLHEVSVVQAFPAYDGTSIAARARMDDATRLKLALLYLETL